MGTFFPKNKPEGRDAWAEDGAAALASKSGRRKAAQRQGEGAGQSGYLGSRHTPSVGEADISPAGGGERAPSRRWGNKPEPTSFAEIMKAAPRKVAQGNVAFDTSNDNKLGGGLVGLSEEDALASASRVSNTTKALEVLIKEGDPRFRDKKIWTPHRPERRKRAKAASASACRPRSSQPATSRPLLPILSMACAALSAIRCCWASPGSGKTLSPWPR